MRRNRVNNLQMRYIVLDTETTGFHAEKDDRIVEIGALELINYVPTGRVYHQYINPQRPIPAEVVAVHGIDDAMVKDKPIYAEIVDAFDAFIGTDSQLVIHNAEFDMRFLNAEYKRLGLTPLPMSRALDTLAMARKLFPGAPNSLDALCRRYNVDNSKRVYHGALMDAELLAEVFLELAGGRQPELLGGGGQNIHTDKDVIEDVMTAPVWPIRNFAPSPDELEAHEAMLKLLKDPVWSIAN